MFSKAVIKLGVPQGTVSGPLLFLIYINDLPEKITSSLKLFADDSYMYRVINNAQDNLELQNDLDILSEWEIEWSMEFHPDKFKVLRVTNKLNQIRRYYHIHGHTLDTVDCAKYLGVTINKKLSWQPHLDAICKKANPTRAFLQRNLKDCYPEIKEQCYKTYIRPQLEYASVVWDHVGDGNSHLRHQWRAARFVYDDWRWESSPTRMINHLNWQSLETRLLLSRLTFFHKHHHKQIDLNDCIAVKSRGINPTFQTIHSRVRSYANSFVPATISVWNSVPADIRTEADLSNSKLKLINHIE